MTVDLSYAFGLSPEQAVKYFESKGYTFSWNWRDTFQQAHTRAFTVAKALRGDVLEDLNWGVGRALREGRTLEQFQRDVMPLLQSKGWWGKVLIGDGEGGGQVVQLGSPYRLRTIYQTNLQTSYLAGRYQAMMANVANRPYWMYVAILDARTRPEHRALHGTIARYDSPFWRYFYPPNGFNCRCTVQALTQVEAINMVQDGNGTWVKEENFSVGPKEIPGSAGEFTDVAEYRLTGPDGKELIVSPDIGWNYNVGRSWLEPFTPHPLDPDNLPVGIKFVGSDTYPKPPLEGLPAKKLVPEMLLPAHQQSGWTEKAYIDRFLGEFGGKIGTPMVYRDVLDDPVVISEELFRDRQLNKLKVFKSDREVYLKMLADTIKDPAEIWLLRVQGLGKERICKRYIGLYQGDDGKLGGFVVFDLIDDLWQGTTTFKPRNLTNLDNQRQGVLLYTKK